MVKKAETQCATERRKPNHATAHASEADDAFSAAINARSPSRVYAHPHTRALRATHAGTHTQAHIRMRTQAYAHMYTHAKYFILP